MCASRKGHCEVAKLLIENGAKVDLHKNDGESALMYASRNGHCEVAKLLIENGAKVDLQENDGGSALMFSCQNGHCEVAKLLLENCAKIDLQNNEGQTSLSLAHQKGHYLIEKLLLQYYYLQNEEGHKLANHNESTEVVNFLFDECPTSVAASINPITERSDEIYQEGKPGLLTKAKLNLIVGSKHGRCDEAQVVSIDEVKSTSSAIQDKPSPEEGNTAI